MPFSVPLNFYPPIDEDITALNVYESTTSDGSFTLIDTTNNVGDYPDYISSYVTTQAFNVTDWFSIQWVDSSGAYSDLSIPVKGGTKTLVGDIVDRVLLRDSSLNENVVGQEAENAVYRLFSVDPYSVDPAAVNYFQLGGLTELTLATTKYASLITDVAVVEYTTGIVSLEIGPINQAIAAIQDMENRALKKLGIKVSVIGQLATNNWRNEVISREWDRSRAVEVVSINEVIYIQPHFDNNEVIGTIYY